MSRGARLLLGGLLLAAAGCSLPKTPVAGVSSTPRPTSSARTQAGLDPGWSLHSDSAGGFAVGLPDSWAAAQRDSPTLGSDLAAIAQRAPELGPYFRDNLGGGGAAGPALLAADPTSLSLGYVTNLAVFRTDLGPVAAAPDLQAVVSAKVAALRKDSTVGSSIDQRNARLAGMDARRLVYGFKAGTRSVGVVAYLLLAQSGKQRIEYEVSMGGAITDYAQLFDKLAASFKLLPRSALPVRPRPSPSR